MAGGLAAVPVSVSGFRFSVSGFPVSGFRFLDSGFWIPVSGFRFLDSGFWIPGFGFRFPVILVPGHYLLKQARQNRALFFRVSSISGPEKRSGLVLVPALRFRVSSFRTREEVLFSDSGSWVPVVPGIGSQRSPVPVVPGFRSGRSGV